MDLHIAVSRTEPLRPQLEHALRGAIRSGRLVEGTKLPPSRTLASDLGISRTVVVDAYAQLVAEGYLVARQGDSTRVAPAMANAETIDVAQLSEQPPAGYNLRSGIPDLSAFPRREWAAAVAEALRELPDFQLGYISAIGLPELRKELVSYLGRVRAVASSAECIVVTCGCTHGMSILWHVLRLRGATRVAIEDPCWNQIARTVIQEGLVPVPIPVDEHGLRVEALDGADVSAVVISPAHQYPIGSVLAPERRSALIAWARRHGTLVVEDDYDAEFRYDREPIGSLQGLAPDSVAYLGSVSKTLAPGASLGWMAVPRSLTDEVTSVLEGPRAQPSAFVQAAYGTLLETGSVDRHLRRLRRVYGIRRERLIAALNESVPGSRVSGASAGLHVLLWLGEDLDEEILAAGCAREGVTVDTMQVRCATTRGLPAALILGYGGIEESAIAGAVAALTRAVAKTRQPASRSRRTRAVLSSAV